MQVDECVLLQAEMRKEELIAIQEEEEAKKRGMFSALWLGAI